jgi:hypothetical protein
MVEPIFKHKLTKHIIIIDDLRNLKNLFLRFSSCILLEGDWIKRKLYNYDKWNWHLDPIPDIFNNSLSENIKNLEITNSTNF